MSKNPTTITYDGKVIATFGAGQTAILKTAGDAVEHDIVVTAGSGGGGGTSASVIVDGKHLTIDKAAVKEDADNNTLTIGG